MMSISVEAAEARDSLTDDKEIVNTYEVRLDLLILHNIDFILNNSLAAALFSILLIQSTDIKDLKKIIIIEHSAHYELEEQITLREFESVRHPVWP